MTIGSEILELNRLLDIEKEKLRKLYETKERRDDELFMKELYQSIADTHERIVKIELNIQMLREEL